MGWFSIFSFFLYLEMISKLFFYQFVKPPTLQRTISYRQWINEWMCQTLIQYIDERSTWANLLSGTNILNPALLLLPSFHTVYWTYHVLCCVEVVHTLEMSIAKHVKLKSCMGSGHRFSCSLLCWHWRSGKHWWRTSCFDCYENTVKVPVLHQMVPHLSECKC